MRDASNPTTLYPSATTAEATAFRGHADRLVRHRPSSAAAMPSTAFRSDSVARGLYAGPRPSLSSRDSSATPGAYTGRSSRRRAAMVNRDVCASEISRRGRGTAMARGETDRFASVTSRSRLVANCCRLPRETSCCARSASSGVHTGLAWSASASSSARRLANTRARSVSAGRSSCARGRLQSRGDGSPNVPGSAPVGAGHSSACDATSSLTFADVVRVDEDLHEPALRRSGVGEQSLSIVLPPRGWSHGGHALHGALASSR